MSSCLIQPYGFVGDAIMSSGAARKLKEEGQFEQVDMIIWFAQLVPLMRLNPWIDHVIQPNDPYLHWDRMFRLTETTKFVPPPYQFQQECGVRDPDTRFELATNPFYDDEIEKWMDGKRYIAFMDPSTWREKAFLFTREQYERAIDVPYLGYGGQLRDIKMIVDALAQDFIMVQVGAPLGVTSRVISNGAVTGNWQSLEWDASVIKHAAFFIGAEGGLANVAAGVGTRTILTSDFVWQLYGPKGVIKSIPEPKLGPRYYFPEAGHIDLDPYLTDAEVLSAYQTLLRSETI